MATKKPKVMDTSHLQPPVELAQSQPSEAQPKAQTSYVGGVFPTLAPPRKTMPARPFSASGAASISTHRIQQAADAVMLKQENNTKPASPAPAQPRGNSGDPKERTAYLASQRAAQAKAPTQQAGYKGGSGADPRDTYRASRKDAVAKGQAALDLFGKAEQSKKREDIEAALSAAKGAHEAHTKALSDFGKIPYPGNNNADHHHERAGSHAANVIDLQGMLAKAK